MSCSGTFYLSQFRNSYTFVRITFSFWIGISTTVLGHASLIDKEFS